MKGLAKEHVCLTHGHSVVMARGEAARGWVEGSDVGVGNEDICNSVKNKKQEKK